MSESIIIRPLRHLKKTTYQVSYYDEDGKRARKNKKTKFEAEQLRDELLQKQSRRLAIENLKESGVVFETPTQAQSLHRVTIQDALKKFYLAKKSALVDPKDLKSLEIEKLAYNLFGEFAIDHSGKTFVDEVDLSLMEAFRVSLQGRGIKNATVVRKENSVKAFLNYCVDHKFLRDNPASRLLTLPVITPPRKSMRGTNYRELLEGALPEWCSEPFILQGETCARNIEILRIKIGDLVLHAKEVKLISMKGNRVHERIIPLTERGFKVVTAALCKRMLEDRAKDSDYLFLNSMGNPITSDNYCDVVKKTRRKLEMPEWATAYVMRHDGLKELRRNKVHQSLISEIAGHRKAETTAHYLKGDSEELRNVVNLVEIAKKKSVS